MSWKSGTIIRNKLSGKPLLVLQSHKGYTNVVDLLIKENPTPALYLLERDYNQWINEALLNRQEKKRLSWYDMPTITWKIVGI